MKDKRGPCYTIKIDAGRLDEYAATLARVRQQMVAAAYCPEIQKMLKGEQTAKEAEKNAKRKIRRER